MRQSYSWIMESEMWGPDIGEIARRDIPTAHSS